MLKVGVFYPNKDDADFDMDYYCTKHIPMVKEKLGDALKDVVVEKGLGGAVPGSPAPYMALCHMSFDSVEEFQNAFGPHAEAIMGDVPNYTNVQPLVQISEVKV